MTAISMMTQASRLVVASTFDPITAGSPLHVMWGDDPNWAHPADGVVMSSWRNSGSVASSNPSQVGADSLKPLYRASIAALGGKAGAEFDGVDDVLFNNVTDIAQPYKGIIVGKYLSGTTGRLIFGSGGGASQGLRISGTSHWTLSNGTDLQGSATTNTNGHVWRFTIDSANTLSQLWLDGVSDAGPGTTGTAAGLQYLKLGSGGAGATMANYANCQIALVAIYASTVSDATLAQIAADAKTYYGL